MRGIAELVEVSHAPPTTSPVTFPSATQFNGVVSGPPDAGELANEDANKTPEPPVATHPSSTAHVDKPSTATQDLASIKPHPQVVPAIDSPNTSANFAKMRSRLAQQMGLSAEAGDDIDNGSSDRGSHSPSHSPVVQRRAAKAAAPPPPKREKSTTLVPNRHSISSSTSSNQSPRSHDQRRSVDVAIAMQRQAVPRSGMEYTDGLTPAKKSFSVEDITAALDDMVSEDQYLQENAGKAKATPPVASDAGGTGDELDALSRALQGFPPKSAGDPSGNE